MIEGKLVNLRPLIREDLALIDSWNRDAESIGIFNFFGYRTIHKVERDFNETGCLTPDFGRFMVVHKNGTAIGDVSYHSENYGPASTCRAYNIGISLIPGERGKGYGVEAQRLLTDYLFQHSLVERIEASTDIENLGEQRALQKAGFTREGVLRHTQFRAGAWHDLVLYSCLRGE